MNVFHFAKDSPSKFSSHLTFSTHTPWKRTFMVTEKGVKSPIGSKILADSFNTDRLEAGRAFGSERSERNYIPVNPEYLH